MVSTQKWSSTTVFNIDNNHKCFLSSKSVYYYDFWRSCDTEDWSNDDENTAVHHRNKLQFNRYSHRKQLLEIVILLHVFTIFWIKKKSFGEQKRLKNFWAVVCMNQTLTNTIFNTHTVFNQVQSPVQESYRDRDKS